MPSNPWWSPGRAGYLNWFLRFVDDNFCFMISTNYHGYINHGKTKIELFDFLLFWFRTILPWVNHGKSTGVVDFSAGKSLQNSMQIRVLVFSMVNSWRIMGRPLDIYREQRRICCVSGVFESKDSGGRCLGPWEAVPKDLQTHSQQGGNDDFPKLWGYPQVP